MKAPEGDYEVPERSYKMLVHLDKQPKAIVENGKEISSGLKSVNEQIQKVGWYFNEESGELHVRLSGNSNEDIKLQS